MVTHEAIPKRWKQNHAHVRPLALSREGSGLGIVAPLPNVRVESWDRGGPLYMRLGRGFNGPDGLTHRALMLAIRCGRKGRAHAAGPSNPRRAAANDPDGAEDRSLASLATSH